MDHILLLVDTILMKKPFSGPPVGYGDYFKGGFKTHLTGVLGGAGSGGDGRVVVDVGGAVVWAGVGDDEFDAAGGRGGQLHE